MSFPNYLLLALLGLLVVSTARAEYWTDPYDVIWNTPSDDAAGSMPLGNGEVGINLWVEKNGDLNFYISRSDSFSEISRLLKVGQVHVAITPNPFVAGAHFEQRLHLHDGVCEITAGQRAGTVQIRVFIEPDRPVIHINGKSSSPISIKASVISWRTEKRTITGDEQRSAWTLRDAPFPLEESADAFKFVDDDAVAWRHFNDTSAVKSTIDVQSLGSIADKIRDRQVHRIFGGFLTGEGFKTSNGLPRDDYSINTPAAVLDFKIQVAAPCGVVPGAHDFSDADVVWTQWAMEAIHPRHIDPDAPSVEQWWHQFWDRSWVITNGGTGIPVPANRQPLRVGFDSDNNSKFPGELARVATYSRVLSNDEIARLASIQHDQPSPIASDKEPDFSGPFTLEAWIKADQLVPGRIFDKLTAGRTDGFLFDTYPGDTLRLIVGNESLSAPAKILTAGDWHHAAATVDPVNGSLRIFLDGKVVSENVTGGDSPITRGYTLQRYVQACEGRGNFPIKFNGGIFTVEPRLMGLPFNADYRSWGDCYWWQNTRHMYHPMLAGGDTEMMDPLFKMYEAARPMAEGRTGLYHHARGCYFPETMTEWGTYSNGDYGWKREGHQPQDVMCPYWQYAWNQGPELASLMLDRWDYTRDPDFVRLQLLPMAQSVLDYFDTRFKKDSTGKIILDPTQSVETFWSGVINDMPTVAGLNDITTRLCNLPANLTTDNQRDFFQRMKAACPDVPIQDGQLAPAEKYEPKRTNVENPELYAVWPFRLFGIGKPKLEQAVAAYTHRTNHLDNGWGYDGNCAAVLGLTDEATRILLLKSDNSHKGYRWPATWGPNYDWLPDQGHGGNLLETTQLMLLQCDGAKIRLLPAWPKQWDVSFKLHAVGNTVVECVYRAGKIEKLDVTPPERRADLVMP